MPYDIKQAIQVALEQGDFPRHFQLITQIQSENELLELIEQALDIVLLQQNYVYIKQLMQLKLNHWRKEQLFARLMPAFADLNAFEMAVGLVVLHEPEQLQAGRGWYLLAKAWLEKNEFNVVKKACRYIEKHSEKIDLIKKALEKLQVMNDSNTWLEWFDYYTRLVTTEPNYRLDALIEPGCKMLLLVPNFEGICENLKKLSVSSLTTRFFYKLFVMMLCNKQYIQCDQLAPILPAELDWLSTVKQALNDENSAWVFTKLDCNDATNLMSKMAINFLEREIATADDILTEKILKIVVMLEQLSTKLVLEICYKLFEQQRLDVVIALLPNLNDYKKFEIILSLLKHKLSERQYSAILNQVDELLSFGYEAAPYSAQIRQLVPKSIFDSEINKRALALAAEASQEFADQDKVSKKDERFKTIIDRIDKLLVYEQFNAAYLLCQKVTPSKDRDERVLSLFQYVLRATHIASNQIDPVKVIALFLSPIKRQQLTKYWFQYQKNNYREALKGLISLKDPNEFLQLINECVDEIIQENDLRKATEFLISIKIFDLVEHYLYQTDEVGEITKIKRKIAKTLIHACANEKNIIKLIKRNLPSVAAPLLFELLAAGLLSPAIVLLNQNIKKTTSSYDHEKLPDELDKIFTKYLLKQELSKELVMAINFLQSESLQKKFIKELFSKTIQKLKKLNGNEYLAQNDNQISSYPLNMDIIKSIPIQSLKVDYTIELMVAYIRTNQFSAAIEAAANLSPVWRSIASHAATSQYDEILDELLYEEVNNQALTDWFLTNWLKNKTSSLLSKEIIKFIRIIQVARQYIDSDCFEAVLGKVAEASKVETLFSRTLMQWKNMLDKDEAYEEFIDCITKFLDVAKDCSIITYLVNTMTPICIKLIDQEIYHQAIILFRLILEHASIFPYSLADHILNALILKQKFEQTEQIINFVPAKEHHWKESATLKICEKLFEIDNFIYCLFLLKPYYNPHTLAQIKKWAIMLVNNDKFIQAARFLEIFSNNDSEEDFFAEIIDCLIVKKQLEIARSWLEKKISLPGTKLRLKEKLQTTYLAILEAKIGKDRKDALYRVSEKMNQFLSKIGAQPAEANNLKNEIIVELRSQLDKAFLDFYRRQYGDPPLRSNKPTNVYFPVVPDLQGKSVKQRLQDYFQFKLAAKNFSSRFQKLFDYLVMIQPLHNKNYQWLEILYCLANAHKHDCDLPLILSYDGNGVDMTLFLPEILDGVTELLLVLFSSKIDLNEVRTLKFSLYVKCTKTCLLANFSSGIFQKSTANENSNSLNNNLKCNLK